ncbi:MAG: radical SAM protein [Polyangiaceae bacterium]|nr:radical SAM protein [Polyangiaceae bacterium]
MYGPVPSRRLGRSLGVDLVPFKTCSYDCVYCQLGRTTNKTTDRREYVPVDAVLAELRGQLEREPRPDFIALAGSGEPTLHARLGDVLGGIKALTSVPVAVLTNGSLLWKPEVRGGMAGADLVIPSLDAGGVSTFERVNRPSADISFPKMAEGLVTFSHEFRGRLWLEVLILSGITDHREEIESIARLAERMRLDRVQLNTVSRPPADPSALSVTRNELEAMKRLFSCPCEVIAETGPLEGAPPPRSENAAERIVALVNRRPCTVEGLASGLDLRPNDVVKHLDVLSAGGAVRAVRRGGAVFYEGTANRW